MICRQCSQSCRLEHWRSRPAPPAAAAGECCGVAAQGDGSSWSPGCNKLPVQLKGRHCPSSCSVTPRSDLAQYTPILLQHISSHLQHRVMQLATKANFVGVVGAFFAAARSECDKLATALAANATASARSFLKHSELTQASSVVFTQLYHRGWLAKLCQCLVHSWTSVSTPFVAAGRFM